MGDVARPEGSGGALTSCSHRQRFNDTTDCQFAALAGFLFLNALYLQEDVRGFSSLHAGLLTLPMAVMTAVLPPISGRVVATRGARFPLVVGGAGIAASGVLLLTLDGPCA